MNNPILNNKNIVLTGSRARVKYKKYIKNLLNDIGHKSLIDVIEFNTKKEDYDCIYIGSATELLPLMYKLNVTVIKIGEKYTQFVYKNNIYDIYFYKNNNCSGFYYLFIHLLFGKKFNILLRTHAKRKGLILNQYGLFNRKNMKKIYNIIECSNKRILNTNLVFNNIFNIINFIYQY